MHGRKFFTSFWSRLTKHWWTWKRNFSNIYPWNYFEKLLIGRKWRKIEVKTIFFWKKSPGGGDWRRQRIRKWAIINFMRSNRSIKIWEKRWNKKDPTEFGQYCKNLFFSTDICLDHQHMSVIKLRWWGKW